jgi:protoporphyrinogen IX oxidase
VDTAFKLLFIIHLVSLVVGGATNVAMPLVGRQLAGATPEVLARLGPIARRLQLNSQVALGLLVVTGIAMLWLRYDGQVTALGPWFIAKLAFVGVILAALAAGLVLKPEQVNPKIFGLTMRIALIGIVVCSVMTFG